MLGGQLAEEQIVLVRELQLINNLQFLIDGSHTPMPICLDPIRVKKEQFQNLLGAIPAWDKLVLRLSEDLPGLRRVLQGARKQDQLVDWLLEVAGKAKAKGLAFIRNDFMYHSRLDCFKQVQINSVSIALLSVTEKLVQLLRMLGKDSIPSKLAVGFPKIEGLVLVITAEKESNIFDIIRVQELLLKLGIQSQRATPREAVGHCTFEGSRGYYQGKLIGCVYLRTGYVWEQYSPELLNLRERLQMSELYCLPSAALQLSCMKRVQAQFHREGFLEQYLSREEADTVRGQTLPVHSFDYGEARLEPGVRYVLKSQREGGGSIFSHEEAMAMLQEKSVEQLREYILMEEIPVTPQRCRLLNSKSLRECSCVFEVGVCSGVGGVSTDHNYVVKVKQEGTKEGGVVMGCSFLGVLAS